MDRPFFAIMIFKTLFKYNQSILNELQALYPKGITIKLELSVTGICKILKKIIKIIECLSYLK